MERRSEWSRFAAAGRGFLIAWRREPHLRAHGAAVALVSCVAGAAGLNEAEWLWLLSAMALVVVAEAGNAAVERSVDLAAAGHHNGLARDAKDMAAGAVLLAAVHAVVGGSYVFLWRRGAWALLKALAAWPGRTPWAWAAYAAAVAVVLAALSGGEGAAPTRR